jgi:hypothetical protein
VWCLAYTPSKTQSGNKRVESFISLFGPVWFSEIQNPYESRLWGFLVYNAVDFISVCETHALFATPYFTVCNEHLLTLPSNK